MGSKLKAGLALAGTLGVIVGTIAVFGEPEENPQAPATGAGSAGAVRTEASRPAVSGGRSPASAPSTLEEASAAAAEAKIARLYREFEKLPAKEQKAERLLMEQNRILFEAQLGEGHPKEKPFLAAFRKFLDVRAGLNEKAMSGEMPMPQFLQASGELANAYRKENEALLSDADFEKMFHVKKGTDFAQELGLNQEGYNQFQKGYQAPVIENAPPMSQVAVMQRDAAGEEHAVLRPDLQPKAEQLAENTLFGVAKKIGYTQDRAEFDRFRALPQDQQKLPPLEDSQ